MMVPVESRVTVEVTLPEGPLRNTLEVRATPAAVTGWLYEASMMALRGTLAALLPGLRLMTVGVVTVGSPTTVKEPL